MKFIYLILFLCLNINLIFANLSKFSNYNLPVQIDDIKYILPKISIPNHYDIELNLNIGPDEYNYSGYVKIDINVLIKTNILILHSDSQKIILNSSYIENDNEKINIINYTENEKNNFLTLNFDKELIPGNYKLILVFEQRYFEQAGLVLKTYNKNGINKNILVTYFEPVYARRIFPCYDEPNLKATFTFTVIHPKEFHAISNGDIDSIESSKSNNNKIQTVFKTTPIMSTYLLALCVSDFDSLEENYNDVKLRIFVPSNQVQNTKFALNVTRESLRYFENLFQIKYDLPKLDSFLFPRFGGGMENWGLIAYGESIIIDTNNIGANVMSPIELICHEIAHQWFGNLVTLDWWDYAWLNEGFASHYSEMCGDMINGNLRFMHKHVISLKDMLESDSNPSSSKPLNQHVDTPYGAMTKFDNYSYRKGSAIVRYMSLIIPNFDQGIIKYLNRYQYASTTPNDLYECLQEISNISGASVKEIMKNWFDIPGYPLITFNITKRGEKSTVSIQQEQFNTKTNVNVNGKWWIPIILVKENNPNFNEFKPINWLSDNGKNILMNIDNIENGWVILNPQRAVFARVNYDLENWRRIIDYLKGPNFEKIHPINRAQLINDANNLAKVNKLPENIVLDLLSYLQQESDPLVRNAARGALITYAELLKDTQAYTPFRQFVSEVGGSDDIFNEPNFKELSDNVMRSFSNDKQHSHEAFGEIANRIYTEADLKKIHAVTGILGRTSANSNYQIEFLDQIEIRYEQNKQIKKNFMENNNFNDVNQWLYERYSL